jgi:hypothetical protein
MIIGVIGKAYSGKSTVTKVFQKVGIENGVLFTRIPFAEEVKRIARDCFFWDGKKDDRGRKLLQLIGTEVGRGYDQQIWIKHWQNYTNRYLANGMLDIERVLNTIDSEFKANANAFWVKNPNKKFMSGVISDDVRFPNEVEAIKNYKGIIIKVDALEETRRIRSDGQSTGLSGHESEKYADTLPFDFIINNDRTERELEASARILWEKASEALKAQGVISKS